MKKPGSFLLRLLISAVLTALLCPRIALAASACEPIAKAVSVQGTVDVQRAGQTQREPVRLNDTFCAGDRIRVLGRSRADIALTNQPVLRLDQNSTIVLGGVRETRGSLIELVNGAAHFFSRLPRNLEINTAFVNAGVEGTEGLVRVDADKATVTIFEGKVLAQNQAGSVRLTDGQSAVAESGKAPVMTVVVRPRDAVQWALYYPPVAYFRPEEFSAGPVRSSLEAYMRGDYQRAFDALSGAPESADARFFAYRASLLLGVGRVDEAGPDIERALKINPNYSEALALQSVIAVVQNDKDRALKIAQQAAAAEPKSATALIALSYAQQANFDLEGARRSLRQAVQVSPDNALAWARLAELHMSFAELDDSLAAAQKAVSLNPNLSRTQMVLGFAHLLRVNTSEAKSAFTKAIELDQADSLSRLGLGLAKIREGDLEEGRKEIEVAASLDPNNSIVRSYLGKAYYEEKRSEPAERDYATAKELDPKDPTPWFYSAIQKQTTNRPVEALQDMERAIELNDNRAVYRSSMSLDSDLAARSASQARIYSDLGFQPLALVEGWKSVNTDPTNYSAHRFLADSYSILARHEIARVSELLQSQLLQPINTTPIQPRLAESNLFLISAGGPGALSFNEFNPIFNRNGVTFQTSGLAGENHTYSGEGIFSGIYKKASFSLGYSHFETDGFRTNNDQNDGIGNAFIQWEISPATSVQAEYRYRNTRRGEVQLTFLPGDFRPNFREHDVTHSGRLGFRHAFSQSSILIGNFMYVDVDREQRDRPSPILTHVKLDGEDKSRSGEMQHLFRSKYVNVVSGVGHFNIDSGDTLLARLIFSPLPIVTPVDRDVRHTNVYLYSYVPLPKNVTLTVGGSGDFFNNDIPGLKDVHQFNPKFGVTWNPFPATTIRGAVFRTLKRTLAANQTLEPTQVAGFNQFFDDQNATKAWRYGAAVDQKFSKAVFGGVEYTFRDMEVPFVGSTSAGAPKAEEVDWKEKLLRAYLFWTPHQWLALTSGYEWERLVRDDLFADGAKRVETHRLPLGINFFHPSGLSASVKATYFDQRGSFERIAGTTFHSGNDHFWVVDAALNYRLPKRYGFITVGATNLFDRKFKYFDTDRGTVNLNPRVMPDRVVYGRITLALP
ncbi:MAG: FecR domain-containing protein [Candidatus Binatia bacterium]